MTILEQLKFYLSSDRRSVMLDEVREIWVKRLYTEHGTVYECNNLNTFIVCDSPEEVIAWCQEIEFG